MWRVLRLLPPQDLSYRRRPSICKVLLNLHSSEPRCQPLTARCRSVCLECEMPLTLRYQRLFDRSSGEEAKRMYSSCRINLQCARHFMSSHTNVSPVEATDCLDNTDAHFVFRSYVWKHRLPTLVCDVKEIKTISLLPLSSGWTNIFEKNMQTYLKIAVQGALIISMFIIRYIVLFMFVTTTRSQTSEKYTLKVSTSVDPHTCILYICLSVCRSISSLLDIITTVCCSFNSFKYNQKLLPKYDTEIGRDNKITSKIDTYGCDIYKQLYGHSSDCSMIDDIYEKLHLRIWLRLDAFTEFDHHLQPQAWVAPVLSPVNRIIDRLANHERVNPRESMRHESLRLCTFRTYPTSEKPSCVKLAKAGFYYASQGDEVICYCCAKRISNWNERDDPMRAHRLVSPSCPFLLRNSEFNEPVTDDGNASTNSALTRLLNSLDNLDEDTASNNSDQTPSDEHVERQISPSSNTENIEPSDHATQSGACGTATDILSFNNTAKLSSNNIGKSSEDCYMSLPAQPYKRSIPAGNFVLDNGPATSVLEAASNCTPNSNHTHCQTDENRKCPSPEKNLRAELLKENRALKAQSLCMKCHRNEVCIAFLPCGHLVSCEACSTEPSARKCFSCDAVVKARIKAFIV
ncbi:uncharacterized protein LOC127834083 isoform X2 [Dreissena polymorpha]|uniref:uncharacterized protein LOC127834083 isoform X2 n=1 Tax=Dreissena polymorpha TaxID=45954 RepID=UPI002264D235|nr:uncharacterized protein LOC127834083 isoform X2 [Dreissena polymorpha]XP_052215635.1 uncharacterized protein LOC127834083 isoform X2 [Dreissena polymorpha]XP_052215636.1 uncharacterized protein LOC127834083 isoform X2 [Dreissena polymorpha]